MKNKLVRALLPFFSDIHRTLLHAAGPRTRDTPHNSISNQNINKTEQRLIPNLTITAYAIDINNDIIKYTIFISDHNFISIIFKKATFAS